MDKRSMLSFVEFGSTTCSFETRKDTFPFFWVNLSENIITRSGKPLSKCCSDWALLVKVCWAVIKVSWLEMFAHWARNLVVSPEPSAVFSFLYLKKLKFQKYMSVLKYFKNIPRSPSHREAGPKYNFFFFKFATKSLEKKKDMSPVGGATGACRPAHGRPPLGPAHGRGRGIPPIKGPALPFPPHLSPKIPPKIQKKREEWGEGKRRSPAGFSTCDLQVSTFSLNIVIFKYYVFKYE